MSTKNILIVGTSRGLGLAMVEEFLKKGWHVIATIRGNIIPLSLKKLTEKYPSNLQIEEVDLNKANQVADLRKKLEGQKLDILFVNAGIMPDRTARLSEISDEDFNHAMLNNALNPIRLLDKFESLVLPKGIIGVMTTRMASIEENTSGGLHLYRSSKTALNQLMRNFSHEYPKRACVLMHPGWVRTDMGGPYANFSIEESVIPMVKTLISLEGKTGLQFLNYKGDKLPW
ncbi:SDR family NAD(P)-dependent oxidoreductase [Acetobacteraceae bacterium]|nr:SDR family NAD(P)-dependent oxidoreductase [Acetobacteraceae bacterium]